MDSTPYIRCFRGVCPQIFFDLSIRVQQMHRISTFYPKLYAFSISNCPNSRRRISFHKQCVQRTYVAPRGSSQMTSILLFIPPLPTLSHRGLHPLHFLVLLGQSWVWLSLVWAPGVRGCTWWPLAAWSSDVNDG